MHNELKRAIDIKIRLGQTMARWNSIARDLADAPRARRSQMSCLF